MPRLYQGGTLNFILEGCKQRLIINIAREVIKNYETVFFKYVSYITLMILNFSF